MKLFFEVFGDALSVVVWVTDMELMSNVSVVGVSDVHRVS